MGGGSRGDAVGGAAKNKVHQNNISTGKDPFDGKNWSTVQPTSMGPHTKKKSASMPPTPAAIGRLSTAATINPLNAKSVPGGKCTTQLPKLWERAPGR